jgi:hypothetical protein
MGHFAIFDSSWVKTCIVIDHEKATVISEHDEAECHTVTLSLRVYIFIRSKIITSTFIFRIMINAFPPRSSPSTSR